jgi:hypothetical protein
LIYQSSDGGGISTMAHEEFTIADQVAALDRMKDVRPGTRREDIAAAFKCGLKFVRLDSFDLSVALPSAVAAKHTEQRSRKFL